MAHVRAVSRKSGVAYEVLWRQADRKMQRTFTVKRDANRPRQMARVNRPARLCVGYHQRGQRRLTPRRNMSKTIYSVGEPVTVANVQIGDLVFARSDRITNAPKQPVCVTHLRPSSTFPRRVVVVVNLYGRDTPWLMGELEPGHELTRAVPGEG